QRRPADDPDSRRRRGDGAEPHLRENAGGAQGPPPRSTWWAQAGPHATEAEARPGPLRLRGPDHARDRSRRRSKPGHALSLPHPRQAPGRRCYCAGRGGRVGHIMTNVVELKPWSPPAWASPWAHERHAQGIDPRIGCGEWYGHGLPMTSSHRLCGSGDEWLAGEYHAPFDLRAYTTRHAQVRHRLICTGCGAESRDLSHRLARRL